MNGPYGEFRLSETNAPIVFIAGGSGMAPIKCILHQMKNTKNKRTATYYFGANQSRELFLLDLMKKFEQNLPDFYFVPVLSEANNGGTLKYEKGLVTDAVRRGLKNAHESEAYLCGSPGMIEAAIKVIRELGMDEKNIFYDKFE